MKFSSGSIPKWLILALWGLQLVLSVVVLGLAVERINAQVFGSAPVPIQYSAFAGGFGMLATLLGIAGNFVDMIPWIVSLGVDAVSGLLLLAGGIAMAVAIDSEECDGTASQLNNELFNLGTSGSGATTAYGALQGGGDFEGRLIDVCKKAYALESIQFLVFALAMITAGLTFWTRGGKAGGAIV